MSRALPKYHKRRVALIGGAAALALSGAVIVNSALAGETPGSDARTLAGPGTISCPDVASRLPAIPATAQAEVDRNLALLQTQIDEANKRLTETVGQGGPNFVQNAILGPLAGKRTAAIDRIAISIGRTAEKPQGLGALAACTLNADGAADTGEQVEATPPATAPEEEGGTGTGPGTISCPDVASRLPAIPATAQAEVDRNLALLQTQIDEANKRLTETVGQGGPNFVQNAILGPLAGKRTAAIDRIAISIGRTAEKPQGLGALAACTLDQ
jgi:F0F1-type ATP synthase membrane subunit b/b'